MRKFVWQKWQDPLNSDIDMREWPGYNEGLDETEVVEYIDASQSVAFPSTDIPEEILDEVHFIKPTRIVNTRLGLLTLTEASVADNHFDFWILHSNKEFTIEDLEIISKSDGVDAITPMTRYRCKIGFNNAPGLFNIRDCKLQIEDSLKNKQEISIQEVVEFPEEICLDINEKIDKFSKSEANWLIYVLPNGRMDTFQCENKEIFESQKKIYENLVNSVGGKVYNK